MLKRARIIGTIIVTLIYIAANIFIFALDPHPWVDTKAFWLTWTFTFPVSYVFNFLFYHVFLSMKSADIVTRLSVPTYLGSNSILFVVGMIFIFAINFVTGDNITIAAVVLSILVVIDICFFLWCFLGVSYIGKLQQERKRKVFYIRALVAEFDEMLQLTDNDEVISMLKDLQDLIKYSDPMSSDRLESLNQQIQDEVFELRSCVKEGDINQIRVIDKDLTILIKKRSDYCKMLK